MAAPVVASGTKLKILLGDGATPTEVFAAPCGLISKKFTLSAQSNDIIIPDCDSPDNPAWVQREITSLSGEVSGSGVLATTVLETWRDWFLSGAAKNIRVMVDVSAANGGGYYAMAARLTSFTTTGDRGDKIQVEVSIVSDGAVTWTDAT